MSGRADPFDTTDMDREAAETFGTRRRVHEPEPGPEPEPEPTVYPSEPDVPVAAVHSPELGTLVVMRSGGVWQLHYAYSTTIEGKAGEYYWLPVPPPPGSREWERTAAAGQAGTA